MNPIISIIVPVYNVEKYLNRCMDSISKQTYENLEIILVDDGSTDSSGHLCDEWALQDKRVKVIHKLNGGLTDAWKTGVCICQGEYIGFVDSDDYIDAVMFETLYQKAKETNADITFCGLVFDFEDDTTRAKTEASRFSKEVYHRQSIVEELFPVLLNDGSFFGRTLQAARVTKLFTRTIVLDNLQYCHEKVSVGEDLQLTFAAMCDATTIAVVKDFYPYYYWINTASITGKHDKDYIHKIIWLRKQIMYINDCKKVYDFKKQIENDFISLLVLATKNEICRNNTEKRKQIIENIKNICEKDEVQEALKNYNMPRLSIPEKWYLLFIKKKWYLFCYMAVKIFLS